MKKVIFDRICIVAFVFGMACGSSHETSNLHDVTDPGSQPVGSAREFWIYESNRDGVGTSGPFALDNLNYFPQAMPTNGEDFFWIADSSYKLSGVQYRPSVLPKISHAVPNIPIAQKQSGALILDLPFEYFDQQFAPSWEFVFNPTFTVARGISGQTYTGKLKFIIQHTCFRLVDQSPYLTILQKDGQFVSDIMKEKTFSVTAGAHISFEKLYTNEDHAPYVQHCSDAGGKLATMLRIEFNLQNDSAAEVQVEFSGMKVRYLTFEQ